MTVVETHLTPDAEVLRPDNLFKAEEVQSGAADGTTLPVPLVQVILEVYTLVDALFLVAASVPALSVVVRIVMHVYVIVSSIGMTRLVIALVVISTMRVELTVAVIASSIAGLGRTLAVDTLVGGVISTSLSRWRSVASILPSTAASMTL